MAKTLHYFELDGEDGYFLADDAMLKAAGLAEPDALAAAFGGQGKLISITLRPATQRLQQQIVREATTPQPDGSLREDVFRTPAIRATVLIENWVETPFPVGSAPNRTAVVDETFIGDLAPLLANTLDASLQAHLFPNVYNNPAFTSALQSKSKPSAQAAS